MQSEAKIVLQTAVMLVLVMLFGLGAPPVAQAEELVWVTGRIVDTDNQPLSNALVAVYDDSNKVVDYARTDRNGEYALAVPKHVLHMEKHSPGFFTEVFSGLERFVGDAAGFVANPLRAGVHAVTSAEVADVGGPLVKGGVAAGGVVADQLLFTVSPHDHSPPPVEERKQPGALLIKAVTEDRNDLVGVARVYWMQHEVFKVRGKQHNTLAAWLDPIRLTPLDSDRPSAVDTQYMRFTAARLQPSIAEPGDRVRLSAKFPLPPDPPVYVVVVARNNRTGQMWELTPVGDGRFETEFTVDKHFPHDDQVISILAYAAKNQTPGRRSDTERAIDRAGLWDLKKPYLFNPLLIVSRNRADVVLTVVTPSRRRK